MAVCKKCFFFILPCGAMAWAPASTVSTPRSSSLEQIIKGDDEGHLCDVPWPEMGRRGCGKDHSSYINSMCVRPLQRPLLKGQAERKQDYQTLQLLQRCSGKKSDEREGGTVSSVPRCSIMEFKTQGPCLVAKHINKVSSPTSILLFA